MNQKRIPLYVAIKEKFRSQREVSLITGIRDTRLSSILNGWKSPTLEEVSKLSLVLNKEKGELFPELSE